MQNKKGPIFMLLAALFFSLIGTMSKSITRLPLTEKLFISSLIGFVVMLINNIYHKENVLGDKKKILFLRGFLGVVGLVLYHYSISKMNLSDATVLYKMTPIFVLIITTIFFKEKVSKKIIFVIVLVFAGVVLVVKPSLDIDIIPVMLCILGSIVTAFAYITVNYLKKSEKSTTIVLYYLFSCALFMFPGIKISTWVIPSTKEIILLTLMGIFTLLAQLFMNLSYKSSAVNDVTIYQYAEILFSFIIGITIFKEKVDVLSILGGIIIVVAITVALSESDKLAIEIE